jgi:hypothetical protein
MNLHTGKTCRQHVSGCLEKRADALLSVCDGLLSSPQAQTLPERSLSPFFDRTWPSVSAALADGNITVEKRHVLCARCVG